MSRSVRSRVFAVVHVRISICCARADLNLLARAQPRLSFPWPKFASSWDGDAVSVGSQDDNRTAHRGQSVDHGGAAA
eukprot:959440-Rhodomonas_salina.2